MRKCALVASAVSFLLSANLFARNPQGEQAGYKLDRNRDRTSSMIMKGKLDFSVGALHTVAGKDAYQSSLTYDLQILMAGKQKGTKSIDIPSDYFSPEFLQHLRDAGQVDEGSFKLKYLGKADVVTQTGARYPNCDKILAFDIKMEKDSDFNTILNRTLARAYWVEETTESYVPEEDILSVQDVQVVLHVSSEIPVLGAARIDISGKTRGMDLKAGFDYVAPVRVAKDNSDVDNESASSK